MESIRNLPSVFSVAVNSEGLPAALASVVEMERLIMCNPDRDPDARDHYFVPEEKRPEFINFSDIFARALWAMDVPDRNVLKSSLSLMKLTPLVSRELDGRMELHRQLA